MSDYFHEETVKELEQENLVLKAQLDELLAAAKPVYCLPLLYEDKRLAGTYALRRLGEVIAMIDLANDVRQRQNEGRSP